MANNKNRFNWLGKVLLWTFFLSIFFNTVSQSLIHKLGLGGSLAVLVVIITTGVIFDIVGVAATAAKLPPLNARAAKKVPGSKQALYLARNSEMVANFCNDVVGDISGIVSGSAAAAIVFSLNSAEQYQAYISILVLAAVAALTVGGKGFGKAMAINFSTEILMAAGKVINIFNTFVPRRNR